MNLKALSLALMTAFAILASGCDSANKNESDNGEMRENLTATQVAKEMGIGENLGNTMEAYDASNCESITYEWPPVSGKNTTEDYETIWGAPVTTQKIIDGMKEAGFNTVRIPVFWGNMMENDGEYKINPELLNRVEEIVKYCRNADLYAVINIHHFDEFIIRRNDLESCKKIFDTLWTQIAEHFKDYSDYVVFEGFNEYLGGNQFDKDGNLVEMRKKDAYELTNALNQTFVDAVRNTGGNNEQRILIASGYWTNIDNTTSSRFELPKDTSEDKLMVSVHYVDNQMYWTNKIGGEEWLDYARSQCELLKSAFLDKNIPVFIGEVTSIYTPDRFASDAKYTTSTECLEIMCDMMTQYGCVPVLWDVTDNFYSRTECQIIDEQDKAFIKEFSEKLSK